MKILADRNILAVEERFSRHGELVFFDGRSLSREELLDADALLVRSITRVDERLLADSKIRFVGTATSGTDHVDTEYLQEKSIGFADAKGSNANAVVDYCFAALAVAASEKGFSLSGSRVGIVGAGAVGGLFATKLECLGVETLCCDPILAKQGDSTRSYHPLAAVLQCDVVSLHVPYTDEGPHATHKLIGVEQLGALAANAILINACRGGVVDETALLQVLAEREDIVTAFDVWEGEPNPDASLVQAVTLATPHIAGYSREAKSNATELLAKALVAHFDLDAASSETTDSEPQSPLDVNLEPGAMAHWETILAAFPIGELNERFKDSVGQGASAQAFDKFRKDLLQRREYSSYAIKKKLFSAEQQRFLGALGFGLA